MKPKSILSVIALLIFISASAQKVDLKLKLTEGSRYEVATATEQTIVQDVMGQTQSVYQYHELINNLEVLEKNDKEYTLHYEYKDVIFKQLLDQREIASYNSKTHEGEIPAEAKSWAYLLNKGFQILVEENGDIEDVEGVDELISKMVDEYDVASEEGRSDLEAQLRKQFGQQQLKDMVAPMYDYLPGKTIKIGDTWEENRTVKSTFEFTLNSTYKLEAIEGDMVTLKVDSEISTGEEGQPFYQGANKMTAKIDGTQNGVLMVNKNTGLIKKAEMEQQLSGEMIMEQREEAFSIPMQLETSIVITTKEL